jgi:TetR/AcrR family transcriptional regulator
MAPRLSAEQRRDRILATSMALFAKKGFAATKTKDLARAAGVSEAMLFKHFPDKGSLYRALIERKIAESEVELPLARLESSDEEPAAFLGRIAEVMLRRVEDDPTFLRLLLFAALEGHPLAAEFDAARGEHLRAAFISYLRRQEKAGVLRKTDPEFASRAFIGLVCWFVLARTVFREPGSRRLPREKLVEEVVTLFLDGVRAR